MHIYGVVFNDNKKISYFKSDNLKLDVDNYVIVDTDKGWQYGKIVEVVADEKNDDSLKNVVRLATKNDYNQYLKNLKDAELALKEAKKLAKELDLNMHFLSAAFTFDRKQLLFNFIADERIDFRELAKKLANIYKTRIELHQIGARDKASMVGGIGSCGREQCCASFLKNLESVSINMAKNQNLALNPSKINGNCGRLLCCLNYEDAVYTELQKDLPNVGQVITKENVTGKVVSVDILKRKVKVDANNEIVEVEYPYESNK